MRLKSDGSKPVLLAIWKRSLILTYLFLSISTAIEEIGPLCSQNQIKCDPRADCVENADKWECLCQGDIKGDGLKGEGHDGCGKYCMNIKDCTGDATCDEKSQCRCNLGYYGDGYESCKDIDECAGTPCGPNSRCMNDPGSYVCTCKEERGYFKDGDSCSFRCSVNLDCNTTELCLKGSCKCKDGYTRTDEFCEDDDECTSGTHTCDKNADCKNTEGSYKCSCRPGFTEQNKGRICIRLPKNCEEVREQEPKAKTKTYTIDIDGDGPFQPVKVRCEMRPDIAITVIEVKVGKRQTFRKDGTQDVVYDQPNDQVAALIKLSEFCSQSMSFSCSGGAALTPGKFEWVDDKGQSHITWGGASKDHYCPCGEFGSCLTQGSKCNCDGTKANRKDDGRIIFKDYLPIKSVRIDPGTGKGRTDIGPVKCANKPFDIPLDCHDAKFNYKKKEDGPQLIDPDGPDGPLPPMLVNCLNTKYPHVGITEIPHDKPSVKVTSRAEMKVTYAIPVPEIQGLIKRSVFCQQDIGYECINSRLLNFGKPRGFFYDMAGNPKNYWGGAMGVADMCACGLLDACDEVGFNCNCDICDDKSRKDFGTLTIKDDLPVGSAKFLDIGKNKYGNFTLGPLMCSQRQFGIAPGCQEYRDDGHTDSYVYLVDPDGSESKDEDNVPPFPVYCEMKTNPDQAVTTILYDETQEKRSGLYVALYAYRRVTREQIEALTKRASYCTQTLSYSCRKSPIFDAADKPLVSWTTRDGKQMVYFDGDGTSDGCACGPKQTCDNPSNKCNCDTNDGKKRTDTGILTNMSDLPVAEFIRGTTDKASVRLGNMRCFETFPSCADLMGRPRLDSEDKPESGQYLVDPDKAGGVEAFVVTCAGPVTIVRPDPVTPGNTTVDTPGEDKCFPISYTDTKGGTISPEQIQALVKTSKFCSQQLDVTCKNAPATGHHHYKTCDNKKQPGMAGSGGEDQCPCGVTGTCSGGPGTKCNCDQTDGTKQTDGGAIVHEDGLAVCTVCLKLDPTKPGATAVNNVPPSAAYKLGALKCGKSPIGMGKSCQDRRNQGITKSETMMVDTDMAGPKKPFPVFCDFTPKPPVGKVVFKPKQPVTPVPPEGIDFIVEYFSVTFEAIKQIVKDSVYCIQKVYLHCEDASLVITEQSPFGIYADSNTKLNFWAGSVNGSTGCGSEICKCNLAGKQTDGGPITMKGALPVYKILLGRSKGSRTLEIGNLECYDIPRNCHEIKTMGLDNNPNKDNIYAVDPDGAESLNYFPVKCDFKSGVGVTVVKVNDDGSRSDIQGQTESKQMLWNVTYLNASPEQINALARSSKFCHQGVEYSCKYSPLLNNNDPPQSFYYNFDGSPSSSFGNLFGDSPGCPCETTGMCPDGFSCRCDAVGYMGVEYGHLLDKRTMPISAFVVSGQNPKSSASVHVGDVSCGPRPSYLPRDCEEARKKYSYKTGEVLIWPSMSVYPFLVYCDMDLNPGAGITVVGNDRETDVPVTFDKPIPVTYNNATIKQLLALVSASKVCQQPIKYICRNTMFIGSNLYSFIGGKSAVNKKPQWFRYFGAGKNGCNCGVDGECGGSEDRSQLYKIKRKCNCDAADGVLRADAGILPNRKHLPVVTTAFLNPNLPGAEGRFQLGKLYCADKPFDLDECKLGFHDCHPHAECINTPGSFQCRCRSGWKGLGQAGTDHLANGRNCYNDDECKMNLCPYSADCTDTPGSFTCTCRAGYLQQGPRICEDIDECAENKDNCHEHAKCSNVVGSFICRCKPGYRGNGIQCEPLGRCSCWGDPHCKSFDGHGLHFQGKCSYTMSRDNCEGGAPSFHVVASFWERPGVRTSSPVTWVNEVTLFADGLEIQLMQKGETRINRVRSALPGRVSASIYILSRIGQTIVFLANGVEVHWDGSHVVEVYVPGTLEGSVCGLCGNYNRKPADDWTLGPACPEVKGELTNSSRQFGDSWFVDQGTQCDVDCSPGNETEDKACEPGVMKKARFLCNKLFKKDKSFRECIEQIEEIEEIEEDLDFLYNSCVEDMCANEADPQQALCDTANNLAKVCIHDYGITVDYKISKYCGKNECGENMKYDACGSANQKTCLAGFFPLMVEPGTAVCEPGCYCKKGFVMDEGTCIKPSQCGCIYMDEYYPAGFTLTTTDCGSIGTCIAGQNFTFTEINCHKKAECTLRDGVQGCFCEEGFEGDGISECIKKRPPQEDPCKDDPCTEHATCSPSNEAPEGYVCECEMGYTADCGNCSDVDECATATFDCVNHATCVNTEGSYQCVCQDGYTMFGGECTDVDECDEGKPDSSQPVCGEDSTCKNTPGGYTCTCCDGYIFNNDTEECEASTAKDVSTNTPCCTCDMDTCDKQQTLCDEDGEEYNSIREMVISRCKLRIPKVNQAAIDYYGKCQPSCTPDLCPKYQKCRIDEQTNKPTCYCESCSGAESKPEEVCVPGWVVFPNRCIMKHWMCHIDSEAEPINDTSPCTGESSSGPVEHWSDWSPCSETCGKGVKTKTRVAHKKLTKTLKKEFPLTKEAACYNPPCPDGPCFDHQCEISAECVPNSEDEPVCECPTCENEGADNPVCGKVFTKGQLPVTYTSACLLQQLACLDGLDYQVYHAGVCGEVPLNCTMVPHHGDIREGADCVSNEKVDQVDCSGGCGLDPNQCCKSTGVKMVNVTLTCGDGTVMEKEVGVITGCQCEEKVEEVGP